MIEIRLAVLAVLVVLLAGCTQPAQPADNLTENVSNDSSNDSALVGGDKDEHGCIGSAGYTWCELRNECLREWETPCRLTLEDALSVAWASECVDEGKVSGTNAFFNNNSNTWWLTLEANKSGCNPACVVFENRSAEINWRCTGLID